MAKLRGISQQHWQHNAYSMEGGRMTKTVRISSKGQVVLPKSLRDSQKWESGTELAVEAVDGGVFLKTLSPFRVTTIERAFVCVNYSGQHKTVAAMAGCGDRHGT